MNRVIFAFLLTISCTVAMAGGYRLNEQKLALNLSQSIDVSYMLNFDTQPEHSALSSGDFFDNKHMVAAMIIVAQYALGIGFLFPFHRLYLGVDGKYLKVLGLYCITLNGLGCLSFVDLVFLIINNDTDEYVDNGKFLMWLNND